MLNLGLIDDEVPVTNDEAIAMMRYLMRTEALAVGLSSAANVVAACRYAKLLPLGSRILTFTLDGVQDYLDVLENVSYANDRASNTGC